MKAVTRESAVVPAPARPFPMQASAPVVRKLPVAMRQELILRELQGRGFVTTVALSQQLRVSEMTLRRDLDQLAQRGLLERSHGGAVATDKSTALNAALVEPSIESRVTQNHEAKMLIAQHALRLILPNHTTIALDIGTTVLELAHLMRELPVRVFTSSLRVATALKESRVGVYLPPGRALGSEPSLTGAVTVDYLRHQVFDIVFLGVAGLTVSGLYDYSIEDSEVKRSLIERATRKVLLVDDSKFNRASATLVARHMAIDTVVTNAPMPEELHDALRNAGVQVEIAQP